MIQELTSFISNINRTSSINDKIKVLSDISNDIKKVLLYTYSPYINFGVTSKNLIKRNDLCNTSFNENLFDLLDKLNNKELTGHDAISSVNGFIYNNKDYKDFVYLIIDKDLKIRIGAKIINKVFSNLIPDFSVALGESYNEKIQTKINFNNNWLISRKLDGVRCITIIDKNGNIKFLSRAGKEFETLNNLKNEIKKLNLINKVIDGEICKSFDTHDDFQGLMKEIRRKDFDIEQFKYFVFDYIDYDDFISGKSKNNLEFRLNLFENLFKTKDYKFNHIELLNQTSINSQNELNEFIENFKNDQDKSGWEGLIARKNTFYQGKRSKDILKIKTFSDAEYIVKGIEIGPFRYVKNGKEIEEELLSAIIIDHKGFKVNVGSGFTLEQRKYFYNNRYEILGKKVCIQYFEESINQQNEISLRFPIIKFIYDDDRDM